MTPFSRDISITLIFKLVLLIALWFFFVRGMGKPVKNAQQWMLGPHISDTSSVKTPVKEG
ncbi:cytochrome oxidase putative small subunit CydP [Legionella sp. CNM-4043-24]|uniref:cytochrome oxidase putative small subunit CydP n=1 Tax=Legionella sp. CNM-4043-24 TaxID=3421646 RepID=UPI00403AE508